MRGLPIQTLFIAAHFNDEDGHSEHLFRYNDSNCGARPCSAEICFGENWHWVILDAKTSFTAFLGAHREKCIGVPAYWS